MKPIFVDTSALIALGSKNDTHHQQSHKIHQQHIKDGVPLITTNAILLELANTFSVAHKKGIALSIIHAIQHSSQWTIQYIDEPLMNEGLAIFEKYTDKDWGLVDCISIAVSKTLNIEEILTTDKHFEQAGFRKLL